MEINIQNMDKIMECRKVFCATVLNTNENNNKNDRHYIWCVEAHVYLFFHGTVNFWLYRSKLLQFYNNFSSVKSKIHNAVEEQDIHVLQNSRGMCTILFLFAFIFKTLTVKTFPYSTILSIFYIFMSRTFYDEYCRGMWPQSQMQRHVSLDGCW